MDPTTTFVLALVAIVVSGLSAVASFWALGQSNQLHPKPFFTARATREQVPHQPQFQFVLVNIGHASAHDLQLVWHSPTGVDENIWAGGLIELPTSHPMNTAVSLVTLSTKGWPRTMYGPVPPEGEFLPGLGFFELCWRQDPRLKKLRRRWWRVVARDGNVWIYTAHRRRLWRFLGTKWTQLVFWREARKNRSPATP